MTYTRRELTRDDICEETNFNVFAETEAMLDNKALELAVQVCSEMIGLIAASSSKRVIYLASYGYGRTRKKNQSRAIKNARKYLRRNEKQKYAT